MLEKKRTRHHGGHRDRYEGGDPDKLYLLLIGASGGVGHIACQIAKAISPNIIVTAVCSSRNIETVKKLLTDDDHIIDYQKHASASHGENIKSFAQEMRQILSKNVEKVNFFLREPYMKTPSKPKINGKFDIVFDTVSSTEGKQTC